VTRLNVEWSGNAPDVRWIEKAQMPNGNGKADKREGKDVSHKKALVNGGSNKDGVTVEDSSTNRSRNYKKKGSRKPK